jgi:hypothetical protein
MVLCLKEILSEGFEAGNTTKGTSHVIEQNEMSLSLSLSLAFKETYFLLQLT